MIRAATAFLLWLVVFGIAVGIVGLVVGWVGVWVASYVVATVGVVRRWRTRRQMSRSDRKIIS